MTRIMGLWNHELNGAPVPRKGAIFGVSAPMKALGAFAAV